MCYTYFLNYKKVYPNSDLKFVLVGKQYSDPFNHPDIIYTNFVEEQEKNINHSTCKDCNQPITV